MITSTTLLAPMSLGKMNSLATTTTTNNIMISSSLKDVLHEAKTAMTMTSFFPSSLSSLSKFSVAVVLKSKSASILVSAPINTIKKKSVSVTSDTSFLVSAQTISSSYSPSKVVHTPIVDAINPSTTAMNTYSSKKILTSQLATISSDVKILTSSSTITSKNLLITAPPTITSSILPLTACVEQTTTITIVPACIKPTPVITVTKTKMIIKTETITKTYKKTIRNTYIKTESSSMTSTIIKHHNESNIFKIKNKNIFF